MNWKKAGEIGGTIVVSLTIGGIILGIASGYGGSTVANAQDHEKIEKHETAIETLAQAIAAQQTFNALIDRRMTLTETDNKERIDRFERWKDGDTFFKSKVAAKLGIDLRP